MTAGGNPPQQRYARQQTPQRGGDRNGNSPVAASLRSAPLRLRQGGGRAGEGAPGTAGQGRSTAAGRPGDREKGKKNGGAGVCGHFADSALPPWRIFVLQGGKRAAPGTAATATVLRQTLFITMTMTKRKILKIILHCSDTDESRDYDVADVDRWHRRRGWKGVGYHYVIPRDGRLQSGRPLEAVGAHCLRHNLDSVGICYIGGRRGGRAADTRTPAQRVTLAACVKALLAACPEARVYGHRDLDPHKECPCFSVAAWAHEVGIDPRNVGSREG